MSEQRTCKVCGRPLSANAHPLRQYHPRCQARVLKANYRARLRARRTA